jgi:hypothetical protein
MTTRKTWRVRARSVRPFIAGLMTGARPVGGARRGMCARRSLAIVTRDRTLVAALLAAGAVTAANVGILAVTLRSMHRRAPSAGTASAPPAAQDEPQPAAVGANSPAGWEDAQDWVDAR